MHCIFWQDFLEFFPYQSLKIFFIHKIVNTKNSSIKPKKYDTPQDNTSTRLTAPSHKHNLWSYHRLPIIPSNYRNALSAAQRMHQKKTIYNDAPYHR